MKALRALGLLALVGCSSSASVEPPRVETEIIPGTDVRFDMIRVDGFWIGRTEVTWNEYELFYLMKDRDDGVPVSRPSPPYEPPDHGWGRGRRPAIDMTRFAAEAYCAWLSKRTGRTYRLPTEAEWDEACGDGGEAWHAGNSGGMTHEVATLRPNAGGIHDMRGNVWEWIAGDEPILRGGSWRDAEGDLRTKRQGVMDEWSQRDPQRPKSRWWFTDAPWVGFRVVRSAP